MTTRTQQAPQNNPDAQIHPTAMVAPSAVIGSGTVVHPYAIIGPNTHIGSDCIIYPFAHIGSAPQVRTHDEKLGQLVVGDGNRFFEGCTVSRGHSKAEGITRIGDGNLMMAYTHIGHDCIVGNYATIANHSSLAGHVTLQDHANIGGYVGIHQFVRIGCYSFIAANSMVSQDVPPFAIASGDRARLSGLNRKGLARASFEQDEQVLIRQAFRHYFGASSEGAVVSTSTWSASFSAFEADSVRGVLKRRSDLNQAVLG